MLVKICGLGSAEQVRAAVDAGADAVGFVFAESVRRVTPAQAAEFSADVPAGVRRVAVMLHPSNDEWQDVLQGREQGVHAGGGFSRGPVCGRWPSPSSSHRPRIRIRA